MYSLQAATLGNTVGALILGLVGSTFLYGVTTLQVYWYYHRYRGDSLLHKTSVAVLWILDTVHLALTIYAVYAYVVLGFGKLEGLQHMHWSIKAQLAVNVVVIMIVQALYAYRVWILGGYHRGFLNYTVVGVVTAGFVIGIYLAQQTFTIDTFQQLHKISWLINASIATSTIIDFVIACAMCYYLWKSKGSLTRMSSRISRMMQYALGSGVLTSACSLTTMFSFNLVPDTFIYLAVQFVLIQFYVGSFLAMLNARKRSDKPVRDVEESFGTPLRIQLHTETMRTHDSVLISPAPSTHSSQIDPIKEPCAM